MEKNDFLYKWFVLQNIKNLISVHTFRHHNLELQMIKREHMVRETYEGSRLCKEKKHEKGDTKFNTRTPCISQRAG